MTLAEQMRDLLKAWISEQGLTHEEAAQRLNAAPDRLARFLNSPTDADVGVLGALLNATGQYSVVENGKITGEVRRRRGAPGDPFSYTQDAAFIYLALVRLGYSTRDAKYLASKISGMHESNIERYATNKNHQPVNEDHVIPLARAAIAKHGWGNVLPQGVALPMELIG